MKKLFIVGGGEMQVPVIERAKQLGHYCLVSDLNPAAPGFKYADIALNISTTDFESSLYFAKKHNIDGILTTSDYPVRTVAYVCKQLKLSGPDISAAEKCTDKFAQRKAMEQCGFYIPKNFVATSIEQIEQHKFQLKFPVVIKPVDSSASRGVKKVESYQQLSNAFTESIAYSNKSTVIVEEFLEGPEFSVESLTQNKKTRIIAITEKGLGRETGFFVESSHMIPALLSNEDQEAIHQYVYDIIDCLGIDNTSTHAELKLTKKGPVLIEIGARLGGDFITSDLVPLSTGVNMLDNIIRLALNESIDTTVTRSMFSGIRFLDPENYDNARKLVGSENGLVVRYELKEFNDGPVTNSLDRLGYVIAVSDNRRELQKLLNI